MRAETLLQFVEGAVETGKARRELARDAALVLMCVEALEGERGDARAVGGGEQTRCAGCGLPHPIRLVHAALVLAVLVAHPVLRRHALGVEPGLQRARQRRVTAPVEIERAGGEVVRGVGQALRRPAEHGRGAAHDERRRDADAQRPSRPAGGRQQRDGAIEPAAVCAAGTGIAALQHVLPVEMRTLAIAGRRRVDEQRAFLAIKARKIGHGRMQHEEAVERKPGALALARQRQGPAQRRVVRVADGRDGGETVHRAAQDNDNQARIAGSGRARVPGRHRRREGDANPLQRRAARNLMSVRLHAHLL